MKQDNKQQPNGTRNRGDQKNGRAQPTIPANDKGRPFYILREADDPKKFFLILGVWPAVGSVAISIIFALFLFSGISPLHFVLTSLLHFVFLLLFLALIWIPVYLAVAKGTEPAELKIVMLRSSLLIVIVYLLFPHDLVKAFFHIENSQRDLTWFYWLIFVLAGGAYLGLTYYTNRHTAVRDIRMATEPHERRYTNRLLWLDALSIFLTLFSVIVIELWFMAMLGKGKIDVSPYELFTKADDWKTIVLQNNNEDATALAKNGLQTHLAPVSQRREQTPPQQSSPDMSQIDSVRARADTSKAAAAPDSATTALATQLSSQITTPEMKWRLLAWLCSSVLCAIIFVPWACLPAHLMKATLIPVTFHERDVEGVFFKSYRYLGHFLLATATSANACWTAKSIKCTFCKKIPTPADGRRCFLRW